MTDAKIVTNRKWKLTLGLIALYTVVFLCLYASVGWLLVSGAIVPVIWQEMAASQLAMWTYGVFGIGGWYLGVNLVQKWSPPTGTGDGGEK